ncbi:MAG: ClbS/DfsB family four-helix bundle protein [Acholeplasma sp.]|nr:ClbS/DfsB family four-helix bundle protein [Acholeplasma sp.]
MARFVTKQSLKEASIKAFDKMFGLIESMSFEHQLASFRFDISKETARHYFRDKTIKDLLVHLYEWQVLLIDWITSNESNIQTSFLPAPYNWKNYGDMNQWFWEKNESTSLQTSKALIINSHQTCLKLLESIDEGKLFVKNTYALGSTIGQYFTSCMVSHYDWAIKKIKKHQKTVC